jgi:hypothetical protein
MRASDGPLKYRRRSAVTSCSPGPKSTVDRAPIACRDGRAEIEPLGFGCAEQYATEVGVREAGHEGGVAAESGEPDRDVERLPPVRAS